jgi:hypothetical protein
VRERRGSAVTGTTLSTAASSSVRFRPDRYRRAPS